MEIDQNEFSNLNELMVNFIDGINTEQLDQLNENELDDIFLNFNNNEVPQPFEVQQQNEVIFMTFIFKCRF